MDETSSVSDVADFEEMETLARLFNRKDFALYVEVMERVRDRAVSDLSRQILKNTQALDQRRVDREQGKWGGVDLFARRFPEALIRELKKPPNDTQEDGESV